MDDTLPDIGGNAAPPDQGPDPLMGNSQEPPMGDGTDDNDNMPDENNGNSGQAELDDIFNKASLEDKNAILKYARSQTEKNDGSNDNEDDNQFSPKNEMQTEAYKRVRKDFIDEIVNGLINNFDLNDRQGNEGTKRGEKKITNKRLGVSNPFISGR